MKRIAAEPSCMWGNRILASSRGTGIRKNVLFGLCYPYVKK